MNLIISLMSFILNLFVVLFFMSFISMYSLFTSFSPTTITYGTLFLSADSRTFFSFLLFISINTLIFSSRNLLNCLHPDFISFKNSSANAPELLAQPSLSADFILAQDQGGLAPAVGVGGEAEVPFLLLPLAASLQNPGAEALHVLHNRHVQGICPGQLALLSVAAQHGVALIGPEFPQQFPQALPVFAEAGAAGHPHPGIAAGAEGVPGEQQPVGFIGKDHRTGGVPLGMDHPKLLAAQGDGVALPQGSAVFHGVVFGLFPAPHGADPDHRAQHLVPGGNVLAVQAHLRKLVPMVHVVKVGVGQRQSHRAVPQGADQGR